MLRWTQERVKELRESADPASIIALQRPAETERYKQQLIHSQRLALDIVEDDSTRTVDKVTPKGDVRTIAEPRWTTDEKIKALRAYMAASEKLAVLNQVSVKGIPAEESDKEKPDSKEKPAFTFIVSGKPLATLIGERAGRGGDVN